MPTFEQNLKCPESGWGGSWFGCDCQSAKRNVNINKCIIDKHHGYQILKTALEKSK